MPLKVTNLWFLSLPVVETYLLICSPCCYLSSPFQAGYIDIWEQATLAIKRDAYSIKGSGSSCVGHTEKFSPATTVLILNYFFIKFFIVQGLEKVGFLP